MKQTTIGNHKEEAERPSEAEAEAAVLLPSDHREPRKNRRMEWAVSRVQGSGSRARLTARSC